MSSAKDILAEAQTLLSGGALSETRCRTIIGRAYYAVYHHVLDHQCAEYFKAPGTGSDHIALANHLLGSSDRTVLYVGRKLHALRKRRKTADYELNVPVDKYLASDTFEEADEIINELLVIE